MKIEQPHGTMLDADGNVVQRFGGWRPGEYPVPSAVETIEYVDGPTAHERDVYWKYNNNIAPVTLTASSTTLTNNGTDSVDVSMTLTADADQSREVELSIDGTVFSKTIGPGIKLTETITTTRSAGQTIEIDVDGTMIQRGEVRIEVVAP
jgi:hypothetical protein